LTKSQESPPELQKGLPGLAGAYRIGAAHAWSHDRFSPRVTKVVDSRCVDRETASSQQVRFRAVLGGALARFPTVFTPPFPRSDIADDE